MNKITHAFFLLTIVISSVYGTNNRLQERYSWRFVDFAFPDNRTRQSAINSRDYIPSNNVPLGTEIWRDKFFLTFPRWLPGIGATLSYFRHTANSPTSPVLIPYPNYEINRIRANEPSYENKIVSVFRLKVDACDRLWFVDTGLIDIIGAYNQVIRPRLFIYDLRTDRLIRQYTFNTSDISQDTIFGGNIVVDVTADSCNRAFAYIPDFGGYRLVVYSFEQNASWRIKHPYFYFDPFASPFNIGGITFLWTDGVFGAALSNIHQSDGFRTLYFTSISTNYQFAVSTRFLRDRNIATNTSILLNEYRLLGTRGPNMQTTAHMLDERSGILFYTLPNRNGMGCWNSMQHSNDYSPNTNEIIVTDDVTMIFPNDIIFDESENLWLLSDRLPVSNSRGLTNNEVNFRLFYAPIIDVYRGTVCDPSGSFRNRGANTVGTRGNFVESSNLGNIIGDINSGYASGNQEMGNGNSGIGNNQNTGSQSSSTGGRPPSHGGGNRPHSKNIHF